MPMTQAMSSGPVCRVHRLTSRAQPFAAHAPQRLAATLLPATRCGGPGPEAAPDDRHCTLCCTCPAKTEKATTQNQLHPKNSALQTGQVARAKKER